jgi:SAM-dependent methyltransferase
VWTYAPHAAQIRITLRGGDVRRLLRPRIVTVSEMERHVRLDELLIGIEGLALLRKLYDGSDEDAAARVDEVRAILADANADADASGSADANARGGVGNGNRAESIAEADPRAGYAIWAASYDDPGNPIVALEQPAVWELIDRFPPRRALDAACGTGRHAARLNARGHEVEGIDVTPEMLATARRNVPAVTFREADLRSIPSIDAAYDLVVCGLALAHLPEPELANGVTELSRVLAPGGRLIISVLHPFLAMLGWQAPFAGASGRRGFVREHPHTHADYLAALRAAGLTLEELTELPLTAAHTRAKRRATQVIPDATVQAYAGLPGVLVLVAVKP